MFLSLSRLRHPHHVCPILCIGDNICIAGVLAPVMGHHQALDLGSSAQRLDTAAMLGMIWSVC